MLTNFPGLGLEIIVDKVFVKETSINVSLSLAVDRNTVDISKVLQFRLMSVATDNSTRFTTLKNNAPFSTLKYNIYNKNNEFNYFDFNVFLKSRTSYRTAGEDGAEIDYFKLGMFEVNHTQEEFRKENILVIIEVKYRKNEGLPCELISGGQMQRILHEAGPLMAQYHCLEWQLLLFYYTGESLVPQLFPIEC